MLAEPAPELQQPDIKKTVAKASTAAETGPSESAANGRAALGGGGGGGGTTEGAGDGAEAVPTVARVGGEEDTGADVGATPGAGTGAGPGAIAHMGKCTFARQPLVGNKS